MTIGDRLGLARRAGKIISGDIAVKKAVMAKKARLIIVAADAAARTREELTAIANSNNVMAITWGSKAELGMIAGKTPRSAVVLLDENMAQGILGALKGEGFFR